MNSTALATLDPTHPSRWPRAQAMGKGAFIARYGIVAAGIPLAIVLDVLLVWSHHELDLLVSVRNALELTYMMFLVAPLGGLVAGRMLWARGQERSGLDVSAADVAPPVAGEADDEQRRLSALRAHLNTLAREAPGRLTRRVIGYTALGYGYVMLAVASMVGGVVLLASVRGDFAGFANFAARMLAFFGFFVLTSLWVRLLEPKGRRITHAGSPLLFDELARIQRSLDAPAPDVVLLTADMNAYVTELPKYGLFGRSKRYLVIGMALLEALPADESRAILAHELAHLSRRHARRLAWTGRLSVTWQNLAASLEAGRHWGRMLFLPFFRWYAPRFALHAQAISRRDEHDADALAANYAGAEVTARALLRLHVCSRFLAEAVLPSILRESADRAEPAPGSLARVIDALRAGPTAAQAAAYASAGLGEQSLDQHTHPSLADRIAALRIAPASLLPLSREGGAAADFAPLNGADALLGCTRLPKLRNQVERDWMPELGDKFRRLHADARIWRDATNSSGERTFMQLLAHARWAADCELADVALPLVRDVLHREPTNLEATVMLGRLLANSPGPDSQREGLVLLEHALRRDSTLALLAGGVLVEQYTRRGMRAEVDRVQTVQRQLTTRWMRGIVERRQLRAGDRLSAYAVPEQTREAIRKACASQRVVQRAHLVRKRTSFLREQPCVMLAVECDLPWNQSAAGPVAVAACQALVDGVVLPETADLCVLPVEARTRVRRAVRRVHGAEIFRRD